MVRPAPPRPAASRPGRLAGEADAEQPAHRAAAPVAADEVARAQPRASPAGHALLGGSAPTGQLGGHPVRVLAQPDQFAAVPDLGAECDGVLGQQALGDRLRNAEDVGMRGVQPFGPPLVDGGEETADRVLLAQREEPLQQTALSHHLDAAHVQPERTGVPGGPRLLLQHDHPHALQPQLGGQHQPGRPASGHDHVNHENPNPRMNDVGCRPDRTARDADGATPHARRLPRQQRTYFANHRFTQVPAQGDDSAARPGPCRKPPGALYVEKGKETGSLLAFVVSSFRPPGPPGMLRPLRPLKSLRPLSPPGLSGPLADLPARTGTDATSPPTATPGHEQVQGLGGGCFPGRAVEAVGGVGQVLEEEAPVLTAASSRHHPESRTRAFAGRERRRRDGPGGAGAGG